MPTQIRLSIERLKLFYISRKNILEKDDKLTIIVVMTNMAMPRKISTYVTIPKGIALDGLKIAHFAILNHLTLGTKKHLKHHSCSNRRAFVSLSSNQLREFAGGNYKKIINELKVLGYIFSHIGKQTGKESYCSKRGCNFSKKYFFGPKLFNDVKKKRFSKVELKVLPRNASQFNETSRIECPATRKVSENFRHLKIPDLNGHNYTTLTNLEGILHGITNAKRSKKNGRVNHRLTGAYSKEARKQVTVDGETLVTSDASALYPFLLTKFIADPDEQKKWLKMCECDPYIYFAKGDQNLRDKYKKLFQQALSAKRKSKAAQGVLDAIKSEFPYLHAWILEQWEKGITVQSQLQKLESTIFIDGAFLSAPFWCLPIHDALLIKQSDKEAATAHLAKEALRVLGFRLVFK